MAVNPKKLRPYDQPPKVRRPIVPNAPDGAATAFLVAALVWFLIATGIGLLWSAMQLFPEQLTLSLAIPTFGGELTVEFSPATVSAGFWNSLVYGWLGNAGLGAIFFITPRLLGQRLVDERLAVASASLWNVGLLAGLAVLYVPQLVAAGTLTEFPLPIDGVLLLALLLANASFWRTLLASGEVPYVSIWYFGVALLALLGLYGLASLLPLLNLPTTGALLANAFYVRALETLCVSGLALGTLYYVVPRATGNPLYSWGLAMLGWLLWLGLGTLAPLASLVDTSVPFVITQLGNVATLLLVVPAFLVVANLLQTMTGRWTLALSPGTVPFALVAVSFLVATSMLEAIGALGSVRALIGGTEWGVGVRFFAFFGTATLAFLALADHAFPRLLRRDWSGTFLAEVTLWAGFAGAGLAGLSLIAGGIAQGSLLSQGASPDDITGTLFWFRLVLGAGLGLVALAALLATLNVFLMYTSARRADYAVIGEATAAPAAS
ncbi:MAG: cbb3-type cytochrome c oxidase subunit I [Chloroflexota bacterium]|nr:cbb3-type cytochrome c oxidase subunit I [Chloroflexota bacterium]